MSGIAYICEGCGRSGRCSEYVGIYTCPVCRWLAPTNSKDQIRSAKYRSYRLSLELQPWMRPGSPLGEHVRVPKIQPNRVLQHGDRA